jgi:hypothetical protein
VPSQSDSRRAWQIDHRASEDDEEQAEAELMLRATAYVTWFGVALTIIAGAVLLAVSWRRRQRDLGSLSDRWLAHNRGHLKVR